MTDIHKGVIVGGGEFITPDKYNLKIIFLISQ